MSALRSLGAGWIAGLLVMAAAGNASAAPAYWIVRDHDSEMILFGSVHLLPSGLDWLPAPVGAALRAADDVWFEVPGQAGDGKSASELAIMYGYLKPGEPRLDQLLDAEAFKQLELAAGRVGLPTSFLLQVRPWFAETLLVLLTARALGFEMDKGVERQLEQQIVAGTNQRSLETVEQQVRLFSDVPVSDQVRSLKRAVVELQAAEAELTGLLDAWMTADLDRLEEIGVNRLRQADPEAFERLVGRRNRNWVQSLDDRLRGRGRTVVVVGAAHLVGEGGLPALLRGLGYQVEIKGRPVSSTHRSHPPN